MSQTPDRSTGRVSLDAHGTLNIVLANRNGFVIATDSRLTRSDGVHHDDGQKLFRTAPEAALAFAGFAYKIVGGVEFEIPATIQTRFGPAGVDDGRGSPMFVASWASGLSLYLTRIALVETAYQPSPSLSPLILTAVGLNKQRLPEIRQVRFSASVQRLGAQGQEVPLYEAKEEPPVVASTFKWKAEGVPSVATEILTGRYSGRDPNIKNYIRGLRKHKEDAMSLEQMKNLAESLFRETEQTPWIVNGFDYSKTVGGPLQIGIFPAQGTVIWEQQTFPPKVSLLYRTGLEIGAVEAAPARTKRANLFWLEDFFTEPIAVKFHMFYYGNVFVRKAVSLDGNIFISNSFEDCTFEYSGGQVPLLLRNAVIGGCRLIVRGEQQLPAETASQLSTCSSLTGSD